MKLTLKDGDSIEGTFDECNQYKNLRLAEESAIEHKDHVDEPNNTIPPVTPERAPVDSLLIKWGRQNRTIHCLVSPGNSPLITTDEVARTIGCSNSFVSDHSKELRLVEVAPSGYTRSKKTFLRGPFNHSVKEGIEGVLKATPGIKMRPLLEYYAEVGDVTQTEAAAILRSSSDWICRFKDLERSDNNGGESSTNKFKAESILKFVEYSTNHETKAANV